MKKISKLGQRSRNLTKNDIGDNYDQKEVNFCWNSFIFYEIGPFFIEIGPFSWKLLHFRIKSVHFFMESVHFWMKLVSLSMKMNFYQNCEKSVFTLSFFRHIDLILVKCWLFWPNFWPWDGFTIYQVSIITVINKYEIQL